MSQLLTLFNRRSSASLTLPSTPLAVYSVVKTPAWGGACCRIKRASDNTQTDIGFTASGYMDTAAAIAFAAGSIITVEKWYDQSGNGYDATATSNQPTIISGNNIGGVQPLTFCAANGQGNSKLTIPAGLAVSTQGFTACMAHASGGGWLNFNSLFGVGTQINIWFEKITGVLQGSSLFTGGDKKLFSPRQAQIDSVILSGDASQRILRNNGNSQTVASAYSSATTAGGYIGASSVVSTCDLEIFAFVVYGTALNSSDKTLVDTAFKNAFKAITPFTAKIIYDGDSITAGFTTGAYLYGYPRVVSAINGQDATIYNIAVPGDTMANRYTNRAYATARYDSSYTKNISVIFAGTNDIDNRASGTIVGYGTTIWTSYLLPYIQAMQATGFNRVCVGTIIARNWVGSAQDKIDKEAERLVYNQLIRDNAATYGYTVLDFAGLSQMSNYADTTYIVDAVHPTRLGYNVMGTYAALLISPLIQ